jgi:Zn-finger protein
MGEMTCVLVFFKNEATPSGMWFICDCPIREHDGFPIDESVKSFAQANVKNCENCGCDHEARGATKTIFGKEYNNLCSSEVIFANPDAEALVKVKVLMELWKHIIADTKKFG